MLVDAEAVSVSKGIQNVFTFVSELREIYLPRPNKLLKELMQNALYKGNRLF